MLARNMPTAVLVPMVLLAPWAARAQAIHAVTEATPYGYLRDGKPAGPANELVELSLQRAGLSDYRISIYPWARSYDLALKEPNVLIYLIARTPPREALFKWAGEFIRIQYHFYKLKDRQDISVRTLDDARNYSVGVMRDDVRHQYLQAKGFTKLVVSGENLDNFRKLLSRQVQLLPLPDRDAAQLCEDTKFDCSGLERVYTLDEMSTSLYMAYSRTTPDEVVARTKTAFDKLKAEGVVKRVMEQRP
jgi:polar amino acid transport system substrate-binding protein